MDSLLVYHGFNKNIKQQKLFSKLILIRSCYCFFSFKSAYYYYFSWSWIMWHWRLYCAKN